LDFAVRYKFRQKSIFSVNAARKENFRYNYRKRNHYAHCRRNIFRTRHNGIEKEKRNDGKQRRASGSGKRCVRFSDFV